MNGDACVSSHVRLETAPYHRKAGNDMGNDMEQKGNTDCADDGNHISGYEWRDAFFL